MIRNFKNNLKPLKWSKKLSPKILQAPQKLNKNQKWLKKLLGEKIKTP